MTQKYREAEIMVNGSPKISTSLSNIYDADLANNNDLQFLIFSETNNSIIWVKRDVQKISFKWSSNFWIYVILYIHIMAIVLGFLHFYLVF